METLNAIEELRKLQNAYDEIERLEKEIDEKEAEIAEKEGEYEDDCLESRWKCEDDCEEYEKNLRKNASKKIFRTKMLFVILCLSFCVCWVYQLWRYAPEGDGLEALIPGCLLSVSLMIAFAMSCFGKKTQGIAIGALVVILFLGFCFNSAAGDEIPFVFWGCIVALCVVLDIYIPSVTKKNESKISDAARDYRDKVMGEYYRREEQIRAAHLKKIEPWVKKREDEIKEIRARIQKCESFINSSTVVRGSDKNREAVNFLLDKLETGRADSLKEALNLYTAYLDKKAHDEVQMKIRAIERQREIEDQLERDMRQLSIAIETKNQAKKQADEAKRAADELERIRKQLEE